MKIISKTNSFEETDSVEDTDRILDSIFKEFIFCYFSPLQSKGECLSRKNELQPEKRKRLQPNQNPNQNVNQNVNQHVKRKQHQILSKKLNSGNPHSSLFLTELNPIHRVEKPGTEPEPSEEARKLCGVR